MVIISLSIFDILILLGIYIFLVFWKYYIYEFLIIKPKVKKIDKEVLSFFNSKDGRELINGYTSLHNGLYYHSILSNIVNILHKQNFKYIDESDIMFSTSQIGSDEINYTIKYTLIYKPWTKYINRGQDYEDYFITFKLSELAINLRNIKLDKLLES